MVLHCNDCSESVYADGHHMVSGMLPRVFDVNTVNNVATFAGAVGINVKDAENQDQHDLKLIIIERRNTSTHYP
ncbi:hypothetical protein BSK56_17220 [Paenibacillus borealis]|uniref:Uncharacterized protein n=1 Tax=Paenibacillus borealis TaxID=160799 RepID=A0ABX3HA95_PAEBO|nr:hypothetical protein BSK56_17220 [Paenibacillus borealis]